MSASEMIAELPKLSRKERRQLAAAIFELEEDAHLLLDMMEEEGGKTSTATLP